MPNVYGKRARLRTRLTAGLSLVELLVTTTIIVVLGALLFAVLRSVRTKLDLAESASRMRQWGVALGLYAAENENALPRRGQGVQPLARIDRPEDWFNALPPYLEQPTYQELVNSGRQPKPDDDSIFVSPGTKSSGGTYFLSYAMNMNLSPWNLPEPTRLHQIENLSSVVFLAESPGPYASTYPSAKAYSVAAPHGGRGNVLFLDGHVENFSAEFLGCGKGDPKHESVRWLSGTASDAQASTY